jgi:hypothetical protein
VSMPVEVGDHVVFCASAGVWIEVDEERLLACRVGELLGVIEQAIDQEYTPAGASRLTSSSSRPQPWRAARGAPARDTPLGLHHLQTHYDIPVVGAASRALTVGGRVERPALSLNDVPLTIRIPPNNRARRRSTARRSLRTISERANRRSGYACFCWQCMRQ